ncbi:MAG TPA: HepT-like ribonuclease domain-containing protein [Methylomirabilota bacterium]|nr:HepT-like ribonuclease domain-containing protein [Methylomirabilota bacterium]
MVDKAKLDQTLIIASENYRFPKDNADSFGVLVEEGVLEPGAQDALRAMARFRNRLVHLYWDVDDERVHAYLQETLNDIARFGEAIVRREW